jgi:hypothetical protein
MHIISGQYITFALSPQEVRYMAQQSPLIQFEDMPSEEARRISRGPCMDLQLYQTLKGTIQTPGNMTARMTRPKGMSPSTMKNRILQAKETPQHWQAARRKGPACRGRRHA